MIATATGIASEEGLPSTTELMQNYPNPFNPSTTIRYALVQRSHVTLTVFNALGERVGDLVNGEAEAGYHDVQLDAGGLASGVYLYRLQVRGSDFPLSGVPPAAEFRERGIAPPRDSNAGTGDFVQTRKLVLLK